MIIDLVVTTDLNRSQQDEVGTLSSEAAPGIVTFPPRSPSANACEACHEDIELGLSRGRDASAILLYHRLDD